MLKITKDVKCANLITHGSKFHADDVFATAFLSRVIDDPVVCRVNVVPDDILDGVIIYDIGGGIYDHHMRDFNSCHDSGIKYASFGLVFREFGLKYLENIDKDYAGTLYNAIEKDLVEMIDATDNGVFPEFTSDFNYKGLDIMISDFNASWNEEVDNDEYFMKAVSMADIILDNEIRKCLAKIKARDIVEDAIDKTEGKIMYLEKFVPFKDFVISSTNEKAKDILFVITPSDRGGYNIHTIPKDKKTKETRLDFPSSWGGLVDEELEHVTGVVGSKFCHINLFLASCDSLGGAYLLAKKALEIGNKQ